MEKPEQSAANWDSIQANGAGHCSTRVLTDSETWAGHIHPVEALRAYRKKMGSDAKLVVVGMVSNQFSIVDPHDPGTLDVVGFDAAVPQLFADFINPNTDREGDDEDAE